MKKVTICGVSQKLRHESKKSTRTKCLQSQILRTLTKILQNQSTNKTFFLSGLLPQKTGANVNLLYSFYKEVFERQQTIIKTTSKIFNFFQLLLQMLVRLIIALYFSINKVAKIIFLEAELFAYKSSHKVFVTYFPGTEDYQARNFKILHRHSHVESS